MGRKEPQVSKPDLTSSSETEHLSSAARELAQSLRTYADASYQAAIGRPDPTLQAAEAKVAAARSLVENSRLAYALGRCIPDHFRHWPNWSKREDFQRSIFFNASEITAEAKEELIDQRKVRIGTIGFVFNAKRYGVVLTDKGASCFGGDFSRDGAIELWEGSNLVAHFELSERTSRDFSHWEYSDVLALRVGPWMQDVLDMAAQIDASKARQMNEFHESRVRDAAKNIDLG